MKIDGNGCTIKAGSGTALSGINSITIPGWSKNVIENTDLSNTNVATFILANLKRYTECVFNVDLKNAGALSSITGNQQWTVTFPGSAGTMTFYGQISSFGEAQFQDSQSPSMDIRITITNLNEDTESAPTLTIS